MIIPRKLVKRGKHYRIKLKDPLNGGVIAGSYSNYVKEDWEEALKSKEINVNLIKSVRDYGSSFDAILYIMSRRPEVVYVRDVSIDSDDRLQIFIDINLKYGKGESKSYIKTQVYFFIEDVVLLEEVIRSEFYFVDNPLRTTENTIKICHIELNRAKALELMEQLQSFIEMEAGEDEGEEI